MLPSLMTRQSVVRKRFPTIDDHGAAVRDYEATPETVTIRASVQPATGETDLQNRDGAEIQYTLLAPPSADIAHHDLIEFEGNDYWVNGEPERWSTGVLDHIVARLSRWVG